MVPGRTSQRSAAPSVSQIDWSAWRPTDVATLVFVHRRSRVLLIRKKRGLGAGKINGPGGRFEPRETAVECALRETREEVGVTPTGLEYRGDNRFQFVDGYSIHVHVFVANGFEGEVQESDEAVPLWTPLHSIPYHEMWEDDSLWLPLALGGQPFRGIFVFDGDSMLDHAVEEFSSIDELPDPP